MQDMETINRKDDTSSQKFFRKRNFYVKSDHILNLIRSGDMVLFVFNPHIACYDAEYKNKMLRYKCILCAYIILKSFALNSYFL